MSGNQNLAMAAGLSPYAAMLGAGYPSLLSHIQQQSQALTPASSSTSSSPLTSTFLTPTTTTATSTAASTVPMGGILQQRLQEDRKSVDLDSNSSKSGDGGDKKSKDKVKGQQSITSSHKQLAGLLSQPPAAQITSPWSLTVTSTASGTSSVPTTSGSSSPLVDHVKSEKASSMNIQLPTKPLDISEMAASLGKLSSQPPPDLASNLATNLAPNLAEISSNGSSKKGNNTVSLLRGMRPKKSKSSDSNPEGAPVSKKPFVRPFEDDYTSAGGNDEVFKAEGKENKATKGAKKAKQPKVKVAKVPKEPKEKKKAKKKGAKGDVDVEATLKQEFNEFREPVTKEKLQYLRYFRLVTHRKRNGE